MKKMLQLLLVLFIFYFGIQILFNIFGKGGDEEYSIKNEHVFNVYEKTTFNLKNSEDNYYFKIDVENTSFTYQLFHDFSKHQKVISDIKYVSDGTYKCVLPIFKNNEILVNALCEKNGTYYLADNTNNTIITKLNEIEGYDSKNFDNQEDFVETGKIKFNKNGLIDKYYLGFSTYQGVMTASKNFLSSYHAVNVFEKDVYNQKLATFTNQYYVVADYDESYNFNKFYIIDLIKRTKDEVASDTKISFDSYIQGSVDGKVYVYDKENKKQYEINTDKKTIALISNANSDVVFYNNGWTEISIKEALSEKYFVTENIEYKNNQFSKIDKIGDEVGFYYLYKKVGNHYEVYRKNFQDDNLVYLFNLNNINTLYIENSIYYLDDDKLYVYNDLIGNKVVVVNNEFKYNKNIKFGVYKKG